MRILSLLIVIAIAFACQPKRKNSEELLSEEKKLHKSAEQYQREFQLSLSKRDTAEAIKVLERFRKTDSTDVESLGTLIVLRAHTGKITRKEALGRLQQLFLKSPNAVIEEMYLSLTIYNRSPEYAIATLDSLITDYPDNYVFHGHRAGQLMELKRYDEAIVSFTNAIKLAPKNKYLLADRNLAYYHKGEKERACTAWKDPVNGSESYYEQYCKWQEFEIVWNRFIQTPGQHTAAEVQDLLFKHSEYGPPPDDRLATHILTSWTKLSRNTPGNETLLDIGFLMLKLMRDAQHYELRCELAKSITTSPKVFLIKVERNRHRFDDLNELVGAFGKELMNDKKTQLKEVEKRILAINSVNATELIKTRSECLLALEKKRERLMNP